MKESTELKIIGAFMILWGLSSVAYAVLPFVMDGFVVESMPLIALTFLTGLTLLVGAAGVLMEKSYGFYVGMIGLMGALFMDIHNYVTAEGGVIPAIFTVVVAGYLLARKDLLLD